jgi:hypothetical protein
MMSVEKPRNVWAWVCPVTGIVWDEGWGATQNYARMQTEKTLGKRRMQSGDLRLVRVTVEPLSEVEAQAYQAEQEAWLAARKGKT